MPGLCHQRVGYLQAHRIYARQAGEKARLLATVAYPELSPKLSMRIGKRVTLGEMNAKGWIAFAADAGVGMPLIRRRVSEASQTVMARANEVASELMRPGLDEAALLRFAVMAADRTARCAVTIQRAPE